MYNLKKVIILQSLAPPIEFAESGRQLRLPTRARASDSNGHCKHLRIGSADTNELPVVFQQRVTDLERDRKPPPGNPNVHQTPFGHLPDRIRGQESVGRGSSGTELPGAPVRRAFTPADSGKIPLLPPAPRNSGKCRKTISFRLGMPWPSLLQHLRLPEALPCRTERTLERFDRLVQNAVLRAFNLPVQPQLELPDPLVPERFSRNVKFNFARFRGFGSVPSRSSSPRPTQNKVNN